MVQNCDWHAHPFFAMIRSKQWKNGSSRILSTMYYVCIILLSTLTLSMPDRCNIKGAIAMLPRARRSRKFAPQCELSFRAISQRCRILPAPHGFLLLIGCVMWSSIPHGLPKRNSVWAMSICQTIPQTGTALCHQAHFLFAPQLVHGRAGEKHD